MPISYQPHVPGQPTSLLLRSAVDALHRHDGHHPMCCGLCDSPRITPASAGYARMGTVTVGGIDLLASGPIADDITGTVMTYVCAGCRELVARTELVTGDRMTRAHRRVAP